jgi:hypothetical protein
MTINSTKKRTKTDMRQIPSTHGYSVIGPVRHSAVKASLAGASSCEVSVMSRQQASMLIITYVYECRR